MSGLCSITCQVSGPDSGSFSRSIHIWAGLVPWEVRGNFNKRKLHKRKLHCQFPNDQMTEAEVYIHINIIILCSFTLGRLLSNIWSLSSSLPLLFVYTIRTRYTLRIIVMLTCWFKAIETWYISQISACMLVAACCLGHVCGWCMVDGGSAVSQPTPTCVKIFLYARWLRSLCREFHHLLHQHTLGWVGLDWHQTFGGQAAWVNSRVLVVCAHF